MPEPESNDLKRPSGRPFPWHCPRCRRLEVRPSTIPYRAERLHEGRLVTVDIPQLVVPQCGHCGELVFSSTTEEQILRELAAEARACDPEPDGSGRYHRGRQGRP
jgi:hypothetical protein